jgi:hypothetical protein
MTASADLNQLERDIEETRARLARDLDRLRSTETISAFKADLSAQASETKDRLLDKAKESASHRTQALWHEIKARAAANPAAALALGAGLAWRLLRRPPVASALVGVGLISLWRTDPRHPASGADLVARSAEFFEAAKGKADDATAAVHERTRQVRSAATELMESATEAVGNVVQSSQETVETMRQRGQEMLPVAADRVRAVMGRVGEFSSTDKERDQILLGAAALALAAAVGIAAQRRFDSLGSELGSISDFEEMKR